MKRLSFLILLNIFFNPFAGWAGSNEPTVSITASASQPEGDSGTTAVTLTVTSSDCPDGKDIVIDWATSAETATAGTDFQTSSGSITFPDPSLLCSADAKSEEIVVYINGDTDAEGDETFSVNLSDGGTNPSQSYTWGSQTSTITIVNDDFELPPIMGDVPDQETTTGSTFSLEIAYYVTPTNGDTVTAYTLTGTLPAGLSFDTATGLLSGTVTEDGTFDFSVTATDNDGESDSDDFAINITSDEVPPLMGYVEDQNIKNGSAYSLDLSYYVIPTNGDAILSYALTGTLPAGLSFDTTTGLLSGTPTENGTFALGVVATDNDGDSDSVSFELSVVSMIVHDNADDLCYENLSYNGLLCINFGSFYGGIGCTQTVPIRNKGTDTLTDINVTIDMTGVSGSMISDCGIDGVSGNCQDESAFSFGALQFFGRGVLFSPVPNYDAGDSHSVYTTSLMSMAMFSGNNLYGSYLKNGDRYIGEITACDGGNGTPEPIYYTAGAVDAVDKYALNGHALSQGLKTRVVDKSYAPDATNDPLTYSVDAVYLGDDNTTAETYDAADMPVLFYLANEECTVTQRLKDDSDNWLIAVIAKGEVAGSTPAFTLPDVNQSSRFAMRYIDYEQLHTEGGPNCLLHSSQGANAVPGLPSCVASDVQYLDAFHQEAYDRCKIAHGEPCNPSHHGYGDEPYNHPYGCYECTLGITPGVCSSDNFAIRPEKFDINSSEVSFPDLMRAGKDYGLIIKAVDFGTSTPTVNYNQTDTNLDLSQPTKYYADNISETNSSKLPGNASWGSVFSITDGEITGGGTALYAYDEVGLITIHIEDANWSAVDNDDTPQDCSVIGTKICGDRNATFIPDHFRVIVDLNNSSNGFTYLSNEQNMSAYLNVDIFAENENNITTQNFTMPAYGHPYYENNITVTMTVPDHPTLGAADLNQTDTPTLLEFDHGHKQLSSNDANDTLSLWFHYPRATNLPVNPFVLEGTDVVVDVNSTYVSTSAPLAPEGAATITGTDSDDANITYVYGRVHSPRYRAMCSGAPCTANVTFFYEFYADKEANATLITNLLGVSPKRSVDSVNWYRNSLHNTATDGNVTYTTQNVPGATTQSTFAHTTQTSSASYEYNGNNGFPYKGSITIPQSSTTGAPSWLIYDKYVPDSNTTSVQGEVEYYGPGLWSSDTGPAESMTDTGGKKNKNTNRRIRW